MSHNLPHCSLYHVCFFVILGITFFIDFLDLHSCWVHCSHISKSSISFINWFVSSFSSLLLFKSLTVNPFIIAITSEIDLPYCFNSLCFAITSSKQVMEFSYQLNLSDENGGVVNIFFLEKSASLLSWFL